MYTCVSLRIDFFGNLLLILSRWKEKRLLQLCSVRARKETFSFCSVLPAYSLKIKPSQPECDATKKKEKKTTQKPAIATETFAFHVVYCSASWETEWWFLFAEHGEGENTNTLSHPATLWRVFLVGFLPVKKERWNSWQTHHKNVNIVYARELMFWWLSKSHNERYENSKLIILKFDKKKSFRLLFGLNCKFLAGFNEKKKTFFKVRRDIRNVWLKLNFLKVGKMKAN